MFELLIAAVVVGTGLVYDHLDRRADAQVAAHRRLHRYERDTRGGAERHAAPREADEDRLAGLQLTDLQVGRLIGRGDVIAFWVNQVAPMRFAGEMGREDERGLELALQFRLVILARALHLGADRLLVIALRNERPNAPPTAAAPADYPSVGQIAGYMLDALFTDSLYSDAERLRRINETAARVPGSRLRPVEMLIMSPSEDPRDIAARHVRSLPRSMRALLWGVGALNRGGMQLVSYLLFESGYTTELLDLGYRDAQRRLPELLEFLS